VRHGKFGKSRELVLHPSTLAALRDYLHERDRLHTAPSSPALLISTAGHPTALLQRALDLPPARAAGRDRAALAGLPAPHS
jgi:hypothetical protein